MSSRTRRLECRASLLALAIATAGASLHLAWLVLTPDDPSPRVVTCPGHGASTSSEGLAGDPRYLEAVETRCRMAQEATERCDVGAVMSRAEAIVRAEAMLGPGTADHAFVRFAPEYARIVWTVRDLDMGARADLDAFDGGVLEYAIEVR
jgi:hypothetical protein